MKVSFKFILICLSVMLSSHHSMAQGRYETLEGKEAEKILKRAARAERRANRTWRLTGFPVVTYTPETDWAFGLAGNFIFTFDAENDSLRRSMISPSVIYSLNNQLLAQLKFQLFPTQKWEVSGDGGYYIFPYIFSGIGNSIDPNYREWYDAEYPRFDIKSFWQLGKSNWGIGPSIAFQKTEVTSIQPGGLLDFGVEPQAYNSTWLGLGASIRFDQRDFIQSSTKGWYFEARYLYSEISAGSTQSDDFLMIDIRKFFKISNQSDVLAFQLYTELREGYVPFYLLPQLGGPYQMRGFQKGIYREKRMGTVQMEYRSRMYKGFLGGAAFVSTGGVGYDIENTLENLRLAYGFGLRVAPIKNQRITLRLDFAWAEDFNAVYLNLGQAF